MAPTAALLLAISVLPAASPQESPPLHEHPIMQRMLQRNNDLRRSMGLAPHRISPRLTRAAQDHAAYMARTRNMNHYTNGGPQNRASRYGYSGMVRENIAMGQTDVQDAFVSWRNSGGHWASIISDTSQAGFGYAVGPDGRGYWVAVYGHATTDDLKADQVETLQGRVRLVVQHREDYESGGDPRRFRR